MLGEQSRGAERRKMTPRSSLLILLVGLASFVATVNAGLFSGWREAVLPTHPHASNTAQKTPASEWSKYHDQAQLQELLVEINRKCPKNTRLYSLGKSVEGRELAVIEFSTTPKMHTPCKSILKLFYFNFVRKL